MNHISKYHYISNDLLRIAGADPLPRAGKGRGGGGELHQTFRARLRRFVPVQLLSCCKRKLSCTIQDRFRISNQLQYKFDQMNWPPCKHTYWNSRKLNGRLTHWLNDPKFCFIHHPTFWVPNKSLITNQICVDTDLLQQHDGEERNGKWLGIIMKKLGSESQLYEESEFYCKNAICIIVNR